MTTLAASLAPILLLLLVTERLWERRRIQQETARKLVHIVVGTFMAFWPFLVDFQTIQLVSVVFFAVILLSRKFSIFKSIHRVTRQTWGELFFPLGIGLTAVITHDKWIFLAAVLHLSVADGFAALAGQLSGKRGYYNIFGQRKSLLGTATFIFCSMLIIVGLLYLTPYGLSPASTVVLLALPFLTAAAENLGAWGLDNVLVPALVSVLLTAK